MAFERLNLQHLSKHMEQQRRNHLVILLFLVGTMKEMAECLSSLRSALKLSSLLDTAEWTKLLGAWDVRWRTDKVVTTVRNSLAFHLDAEAIDKGLDSLPPSGLVHIFSGPDFTDTPDGSFPLGTAALLGSLGLSEADLTNFFSRPLQDFDVAVNLMLVLSSVLRRADLQPKVEK